MRETVDTLDVEIIKLLKNNGRMPNTEIAKRLNLSEAATRKRLKRLIGEEIICVGASFNYVKWGHNIEGNLKINADMKKLDQIADTLYAIENIVYLAHSAGAIDFDADFIVESRDDLKEFIDMVRHIDGINDIEFSVRLDLLKWRYDAVERNIR